MAQFFLILLLSVVGMLVFLSSGFFIGRFVAELKLKKALKDLDE
jgi:uncharacterized protein YneF (UPF0154 family)